MIARSDGAILQWGVAFDMSKEALPASQAAFALFAITGQIDRPGGMVVPTEILRNVGGWGYEELILGKHPDVADKRIGKNKYGLLNAGIMAASTDMWLEQLETGVPYKLSGLLDTNHELLGLHCARIPSAHWPHAIHAISLQLSTCL